MKNKFINFTKEILLSYNYKFFGVLFLLGVPLFTIYRILFFLKYAYRFEFTEISTSTLLYAFAEGIRFDISALCIVYGLPFILSCIDFLNRNKIYVLLWSFIPNILIIFVLY